MSSVTCHLSMSLDGFVAGPNQSLEDPIGEDGMRPVSYTHLTLPTTPYV